MNRKTILIAEDNTSVAEEMVDILAMEGFETHTCTNGQCVLESAKKNMPDLIISDYIMPKMNGADMLTELKRNPKLNKIPVLIISAHADKDFEKKMLSLGAAKFLVKPIDSDELTEAVMSLLNVKIS